MVFEVILCWEDVVIVLLELESFNFFFLGMVCVLVFILLEVLYWVFMKLGGLCWVLDLWYLFIEFLIECCLCFIGGDRGNYILIYFNFIFVENERWF